MDKLSSFSLVSNRIIDINRSRSLSGGLCTLTETHLERTSIPVEQFLDLLNFENKVKLAELPGGIGAGVRNGTLNSPPLLFLATHLTVQTAAEASGYNAQCLRRLLFACRLKGDKIGQVWLIRKASFEAYLQQVMDANGRRFGPETAIDYSFQSLQTIFLGDSKN